MALITNDLYSETTRGPLKRIQPDQGPGAVVQREFAAGSAGTLPVGTPVYVVAATGLLAKVVPGALSAVNDIHGIVYPADVVLNGTDEVLGTVMLKGMVHYEEIEALRAAGTLAGTAQQVKDMCRKPSNITRGIFVEGLSKLGGDAGLA